MYCLKTQQPRLSVKSSQSNYSLQQKNSCRVAISFGYTTPQLFEGKSVTRRCWKDSYAQQFINRWQRGITTYIALDKDRRWGGKQIGTITLTARPYKERLVDMPPSDLAAEGFPELNQQEFIQQFFKGDRTQQVWVIRFRFTPLTEESCSTGISGKLDRDRNVENGCSTGISNLTKESCSTLGSSKAGIAGNTENVCNSPGEESCSTGISAKVDIERDVENGCSTLGSSPGEESCSTGISRNPVRTQLSLIGNEQFFWEVGDRVHHRKDPNRTGTILKSVKGSTRFFIAWDVGSRSAVEGRNLTTIPVEQRDYQNLLTTEPDYLLEKDGQFTIFSEDEPPDPDDFDSEAAYLKAWAKWEQAYPELAKAVSQAGREAQTIPVEQKSHIPAEQKPQTETIKPPKTRNTKPGRGSRPKQVNCNVKRNGNKGKAANSYWLYQFSFKVDGRYYNRSVSIPKEKVNRAISMWESKQYSWQDIVEFIGKDSDIIIEKARSKTES